MLSVNATYVKVGGIPQSAQYKNGLVESEFGINNDSSRVKFICYDGDEIALGIVIHVLKIKSIKLVDELKPSQLLIFDALEWFCAKEKHVLRLSMWVLLTSNNISQIHIPLNSHFIEEKTKKNHLHSLIAVHWVEVYCAFSWSDEDSHLKIIPSISFHSSLDCNSISVILLCFVLRKCLLIVTDIQCQLFCEKEGTT